MSQLPIDIVAGHGLHPRIITVVLRRYCPVIYEWGKRSHARVHRANPALEAIRAAGKPDACAMGGMADSAAHTPQDRQKPASGGLRRPRSGARSAAESVPGQPPIAC